MDCTSATPCCSKPARGGLAVLQSSIVMGSSGWKGPLIQSNPLNASNVEGK